MKNYYTLENMDKNFTFLMVPKFLFTDKKFKTLNSNAKLIYSLFLERTGLSYINKLADDSGHIYILYTLKDIADIIGCTERTVQTLLSKLSDYGLIERIKQGAGKPDKIYVLKHTDNLEPKVKQKAQTAQKNIKYYSENTETINEVQNSDFNEWKEVPSSSKKYYDNFSEKFSSNQYSFKDKPNISKCDKDMILSSKFEYEDIIRDNINYDNLITYNSDCRKNIDLIDNIVGIMAKACSGNDNDMIKVSGEYRLKSDVTQQLMKIDESHIQYFIDCFNENAGRIYKIDSYLLTSMYNAPDTIDTYYYQLA